MAYNVDGDFGQVRLFSFLPTQLALSVLNYTPIAGWHRCNELYHISRENGISTYLLFVTVAGCGQMQLRGRQYDLIAGTAAILPPNEPCAYGVPAGGLWEFYWIHAEGPLVRSILDHLLAERGPAFTITGGLPGITERFEELSSLRSAAPAIQEIHLSQQIATILHALLAGTLERPGGGPAGAGPVEALIRHIEDHYADKIVIRTVSDRLFINAAHLSRLFKARTGFAPYEYLMRYRIMKARELLQFTDLSIKDIAARTGFAQVSNFIHQFKALEAMTPERFRQA